MNYNNIYQNNNVWGNSPNGLILKILAKIDTYSEFLDLGCGQGRDSLFMLQNGHKVTAVDNSKIGINKIKEIIKLNNLPFLNINIVCQNINNFEIKNNKYDIINAFNSLQFLPKKESLKIIEKIKFSIKDNGYIIISAFTISDILFTKMTNDQRCFFEPNELKKIFQDFTIIFYEEIIIEDKPHPGFLKFHNHGIVKIIAQKIKNSPK